MAFRRPALACFLFLALSGCGGGDETGIGAGGDPQLTPFAVPPSSWSHGDPSPLEQELLELMQRARANPPAEGELLVAMPEAQQGIQSFGVSKDQVVADFKTYAPVPPLTFEEHLMASSKFHSDDMATVGFQEHNGSKGEGFDQRITQAGYDWSFISENIFSYANSVAECHAAFLIDWGNAPPYGHREAMLDLDGPKRDVGISIVEDPSGPNNVGPLVVTEDFGAPAKDKASFLVGVVYRDTNGNGAYDAGEGVAGANVVPELGGTYAVTSTSGGYAIPMLPMDVAVQVQIDGKALVQTPVTMAAANTKLDFILAPE